LLIGVVLGDTPLPTRTIHTPAAAHTSTFDPLLARFSFVSDRNTLQPPSRLASAYVSGYSWYKYYPDVHYSAFDTGRYALCRVDGALYTMTNIFDYLVALSERAGDQLAKRNISVCRPSMFSAICADDADIQSTVITGYNPTWFDASHVSLSLQSELRQDCD
jgi:hypothetical protein